MFSLALHGGAGVIEPHMLSPEKEAEYLSALNKALQIGKEILDKGGNSMDAVTQTVMSLEDCPLFNAGRGAVFNSAGKHEMDASIMDGCTLDAGAVAGVQNVRNPILLARKIMEESEHVYLAGEGAEVFAKQINSPFEKDEYFFDAYRFEQFEQAKKDGLISLDHSGEKKFGTVGAVALDKDGNLAAATSTGGMTNKKFGRVGDTPMIGAGTYADNKSCAVSCTGHGEYFIRAVVAHDIACLINYKNLSLKDACEEVVKNKLVKLEGEGGVIALDTLGNIELCFNTPGMYRACANHLGEESVKIYLD